MDLDDKILVECELKVLQTFVEKLEKEFSVMVIRHPELCLTMIQAEDSVEKQPFYLGEALATECEVLVEDVDGIGICLGDEPVRAYCLAVMDAMIRSPKLYNKEVSHFLSEQKRLIDEKEQEEFNHIMRTKVDFKLMDQS